MRLRITKAKRNIFGAVIIFGFVCVGIYNLVNKDLPLLIPYNKDFALARDCPLSEHNNSRCIVKDTLLIYQKYRGGRIWYWGELKLIGSDKVVYTVPVSDSFYDSVTQGEYLHSKIWLSLVLSLKNKQGTVYASKPYNPNVSILINLLTILSFLGIGLLFLLKK